LIPFSRTELEEPAPLAPPGFARLVTDAVLSAAESNCEFPRPLPLALKMGLAFELVISTDSAPELEATLSAELTAPDKPLPIAMLLVAPGMSGKLLVTGIGI